MYARALAAAERAAEVIWKEGLELRVEHAKTALRVASLEFAAYDDDPKRYPHRSKLISLELRASQERGELPPHLDLDSWCKAVDIWRTAGRGRRGRGVKGEWSALALVFDHDDDVEGFKRKVKRASKTRAKRGVPPRFPGTG